MTASLDDTDLRILRALEADPRMPVSRIARMVGLTDNAVRYRMRRLQTAGIIRGFAVVLDRRLLGRPRLALVCARLADPRQLAGLVAEVPDAVGAYECEGTYNAMLFLCLRDDADLDRAVAQLRHRAGVQEAVALRVLDGHRVTPMPLVPEPLGLDRDRVKGQERP